MTKKKKKSAPLPNGANRDSNGRFIRGCAPGPGNPHAAAVARLRSALLAAVTITDIKAIVKSLVKQAKDGDITAIRVLLDRCIGKPIEMDFLDRLEGLEKMLSEIEK